MGFWVWYSVDGTEDYRLTYKDGKLHGLLILYNKDGTEKARYTYRDGEEVYD